MSHRVQIDGVKMLSAEGGIVWIRESGLAKSERGNYETAMYGVRYQLEKRKWAPGDTPDTGWYLYSYGVTGGFFGEWCARTIMEAVDVATEKIHRADLRVK